MDFFNTCRTCTTKVNQEKEDFINITEYCVLGKSYKDVLLSLAPNMNETFLTDDNRVCKNCAETLRRSALLIHKCLMIEKELNTLSLQLGKNKHKDITEKNGIEQKIISVSNEVIIGDKNTEDCITQINLVTAENINQVSLNDYTKKDFQRDSKEKSAGSSNDSPISPNLTDLLNTSLLDGVKKHNRVISLNLSERPVLEQQLSCLIEHRINIFDLSSSNEENGKDVKKRVVLIGLDQPTKCLICFKSIKYSEVHNCPKLLKPEVPKLVQECNLSGEIVKTNLIDTHLRRFVKKAQIVLKQKLANEEQQIIVLQEYMCETCGEKFTSTEEFEFHLQLHPPFVCEICSKGYIKKTSLKAHMVTHNDQNSYICEVCGKGYKDKGTLRVHLKSHGDEETYPCSQCPKVFKQKTGVTRHIKKFHEKKLRCQCPECGKVFATKGYFENHIKVVHLKEKPYKCHICQRMFGRMDHMRNHIAGHATLDGPERNNKGRKWGKGYHVPPKDKGKPAPCKFCGRWFADTIRLERHVKTHLRRFQCRVCPLTFAYKSLCVRHERVLHDGVKNNSFRCNVCWKRLVSKEALDEHVKRHNKPKYTCDQCGMKFNRGFMLNHHKLVDHSNDEIVDNSLVETSSSVTDINPDDLLC